MCLDDEENNIKRIIGKEAIASRPLSEEQNGGQPKEQNNKQNTENTADTTSQNNNTNQEDKEKYRKQEHTAGHTNSKHAAKRSIHPSRKNFNTKRP